MVHELKACDIRRLGARATAFMTGLRRLLSTPLLTELAGVGKSEHRINVGVSRRTVMGADVNLTSQRMQHTLEDVSCSRSWRTCRARIGQNGRKGAPKKREVSRGTVMGNAPRAGPAS
jgi:hypothetical protein